MSTIDLIEELSKRQINTIQEAKEAYEQIREIIRKELEISYVQTNIQNKLQGKVSKEIELNFYKPQQEPDLDDFSELLSESCSVHSEIEEETEESISEEENKVIMPTKKSKVNKYLDLEAEYSGEEEEEEENEDAELDLEDLVDLECAENNDDKAIDKFYEEKQNFDKKELRSLKNKFGSVNKASKVDIEHFAQEFEESYETFSDIKEFELDCAEYSENLPQNAPVKMATVKEKVSNFINTDEMFNISENIEDKLNRKPESKSFGFKKL